MLRPVACAGNGASNILLNSFLCLPQVDVGPYKETRIRAFGPGLIGGTVNKPAVFVVVTNRETGARGTLSQGLKPNAVAFVCGV